MLYDIALKIGYTYETPASGARHVIRLLPLNLAPDQRLIAGSVTILPLPSERRDFIDFFGNAASSVHFRSNHDRLDISMQARVQVESRRPDADPSPDLVGLAAELATIWRMDAASPHHYLADSPRLARNEAISAYAAALVRPGISVRALTEALCAAIHADFAYDPDATHVDTPPGDAFSLRKGVCQDFAHIMIAGLRSLGIPAGYVSGYLRTIPPPGRERLEGADAMHAWVRAWCGREAGWVELDPTNNMVAAIDHIRAGYGRDYSDVAPVIGILKSYGSHTTLQSVDVIPV